MSAASAHPRRRHVLLRVFIVVAAIAVIGFATLPWTLAPYVRSKLASQVSQQLNASLEIGSLRYDFPYGVHATDVRLVATEENVELFKAQSVQLSLVRLPIHRGPLLIEKIILDRPEVLLVRNEQGEIVGRELAKRRKPKKTESLKLSDVFRLRLMKLNDGQVRYEDRSAGGDTTPVVWSDVESELHLTPQTAARYGWSFTAGDGAVADISASGSIDIDQLLLDLSKLTIKVQSNATNRSGAALPGQVQQLLNRFAVQGDVRLDATGHLPLRQMRGASGTATLTLDGATASVNQKTFALDAILTATKSSDDSTISVAMHDVSGVVGPGQFAIDRLEGTVDPVAKSWQLSHIDGSVSNLSVLPPKFPYPLEHFTATLHTQQQQIRIEDGSATYGQDQFKLSSVRIPLNNLSSASRVINLNGLHLQGNLTQPQPLYPKHLGPIFAALNPVGPVLLRGWYQHRIGQRADYDLTVSAENAAMAVGESHIPVVGVETALRITPQTVDIEQFSGSIFDGTVTGTGQIHVKNGKTWNADLSGRNLSIESLSRQLIIPSGKQVKLTGRGDIAGSIKGRGTDLAALQGNGQVQIRNARLWEIPVLDGIASGTRQKRETLPDGDAAAIFSIHDQKVDLTRAALNSPVLGIQGSGTVGFDGQLSLNVIAAPLGDWKRHIQNTRIPILSDTAGEIAGGLQQVINNATSQLLYQFKVTGTTSKPRIQPIPTPILTNTGAVVFGQMLQQPQNLLDAIQGKK